VRTKFPQGGGCFGGLVLGPLEFLPQHRVDAKARGVVDDHHAMPGGALLGRDIAGVGLAGGDDGETGGLKQRDVVGVVVWLVDQLE